jgi:hypothetical protein
MPEITRPPCPFCQTSGYVWVVRLEMTYDAGPEMQRAVKWLSGDTYVHEALFNEYGHPDTWDCSANWQCLCTCENGQRIQSSMLEGKKRPDHIQLTGRYPAHDAFDRCHAICKAIIAQQTPVWGEPSSRRAPDPKVVAAVLAKKAERKPPVPKLPRIPEYHVPEVVVPAATVQYDSDGVPF